VIGRSPDCHVCLAARQISREHAILTVAPGKVTIENAGARNGTTVNGTQISESVALTSGDRVAFAGLEFELVVE
jgi:pSer/pThr/pTyr-binding forkhead associated (FHA) protein